MIVVACTACKILTVFTVAFIVFSKETKIDVEKKEDIFHF